MTHQIHPRCGNIQVDLRIIGCPLIQAWFSSFFPKFNQKSMMGWIYPWHRDVDRHSKTENMCWNSPVINHADYPINLRFDYKLRIEIRTATANKFAQTLRFKHLDCFCTNYYSYFSTLHWIDYICSVCILVCWTEGFYTLCNNKSERLNS